MCVVGCRHEILTRTNSQINYRQCQASKWNGPDSILNNWLPRRNFEHGIINSHARRIHMSTKTNMAAGNAQPHNKRPVILIYPTGNYLYPLIETHCIIEKLSNIFPPFFICVRVVYSRTGNSSGTNNLLHLGLSTAGALGDLLSAQAREACAWTSASTKLRLRSRYFLYCQIQPGTLIR